MLPAFGAMSSFLLITAYFSFHTMRGPPSNSERWLSTERNCLRFIRIMSRNDHNGRYQNNEEEWDIN